MTSDTYKKNGFNGTNAATLTQPSKPQKALFDLEIEQCLLGCIMQDNLAYEEVFDIVKPEHFYAPIHQRIFIAIGTQITENRVASPVSIFPEFEGDESLKEVGGAKEYLAGLLGQGLRINAAGYAEYIRDTYIRRAVTEASASLSEAMLSNTQVWETVNNFQNQITALTEYKGEKLTSPNADWESTKRYIEAVMNGQIKMTSTGYPEIDEIINGFQPGGLYVLAAATGMGKTALAVNIAENISQHGKVLYFSFEMPKSQLFMRIAAKETSLSVSRQIQGKLSVEDARHLFSVKMPENLIVYDRAGADITKVSNMVRKFVRKFPDAKAIFIDYLGLIAGNPKLQKVHQIEEITRSLKQIAINLNIPIILLCQLSRSISQRDDKRPILSDLRDSGAIEQDADTVIFVYRAEYYLAKEPEAQGEREGHDKYRERMAAHQERYEASKGKADIIIAKNRHGELGTVKMGFNGLKQQFYSRPENRQLGLPEIG